MPLYVCVGSRMFTVKNNANARIPPGAVVTRSWWAENRCRLFLRGTFDRSVCSYPIKQYYLCNKTLTNIIGVIYLDPNSVASLY